MNSQTKLALADSLNGTMFTTQQAEGNDLKLMIVAGLEDFFALGAKKFNHYDKNAVLADVASQTPGEIRRELGLMGFAKHLGEDGYHIVNAQEWETYINEACKN